MTQITAFAPRDVIGETLAQLGKSDPNLFVIDCDLGLSTRLGAFESEFPQRYIQLGSQEQNAIGLATGLSLAGLHPVFVCFTMFAIGLPWTQLRMAAYGQVPFTVIGTHPGFDIGPDGGTHQMMEDLALARAIPWMKVYSPSDPNETKAFMRKLIGNQHLNYIRIGRQPVPQHYPENVDFIPGKADIWSDEGRELVFIGDGSMVFTCAEAAAFFHSIGYKTCVVNIRTIKPLDKTLLIELAKSAKLLVTLENHSVIGGLGAAVAEAIALNGTKHLILGSQDCFGESATTEELRHKHRLDLQGVIQSVQAAMEGGV
ncbi:MAG: transketolase C-terminal domain-containing protein [Anaerolineaceae bacterium]|nr:transketolase C-terminal domain-containing protein [Anaerolineaceae bacterium]